MDRLQSMGSQSWTGLKKLTTQTHWRVGPQFVDLLTHRLRLLLSFGDHEQRRYELWYLGCCVKMNYQNRSRRGMAESYGIYTFTLKKINLPIIFQIVCVILHYCIYLPVMYGISSLSASSAALIVLF